MDALKHALREQLENSFRSKGEYERKLSLLPRGSLIKKKIKGHEYYYLLMREGPKVRFIYKGKVREEEIERYKAAKADRARYRKILSGLKKQIRFLKSFLHEGEVSRR
jgi:hypothetical protein